MISELGMFGVFADITSAGWRFSTLREKIDNLGERVCLSARGPFNKVCCWIVNRAGENRWRRGSKKVHQRGEIWLGNAPLVTQGMARVLQREKRSTRDFFRLRFAKQSCRAQLTSDLLSLRRSFIRQLGEFLSYMDARCVCQR